MFVVRVKGSRHKSLSCWILALCLLEACWILCNASEWIENCGHASSDITPQENETGSSLPLYLLVSISACHPLPDQIVTVLIELKPKFNGTNNFFWWSGDQRGLQVTAENVVTVEISWKVPGLETINILAQKYDANGNWLGQGQNWTSLFIANPMICELSVSQTSANSLEIKPGLINLYTDSATAQLQSSEFLWFFGDGGLPVATSVGYLLHNITMEGRFTLSVQFVGNQGAHWYRGSCSTNITVIADFSVALLVWQDHERRPVLPSPVQTLAVGTVNFAVDVIDPYQYFVNTSFAFVYDFGDGFVSKSNVSRTTHLYSLSGLYRAQVDVYAERLGRAFHKHQSELLMIEEPIHSLRVNGTPALEKGIETQFQITCQGSKPVSFCWFIAEADCQLPLGDVCSPTLMDDECHISFNHTFLAPGVFCLNVSAVNSVSAASTTLAVRVFNEGGISDISALAIILPVFAATLLIASIFLVLKRGGVRGKRQKQSEEAQFDFRRSPADLSQLGMSWQSVRCACRSCPRLCLPHACETDDDFLDDSDGDDEGSPLFLTPVNLNTERRSSSRKISYYGTVHMNLLQKNSPVIAENEATPAPTSVCTSSSPSKPSPCRREESLSKSV